MKKSALISLLLCLMLCATALAAPIGFGIVALAEEISTPPTTVIDTTPFSETKEFGPKEVGKDVVTNPDGSTTETPIIENYPTEYFYTYTAERVGMLHVTVTNGTTFVYVEKNGVQTSVPMEVAEGDEIYIEFIAIDATMYTTDTIKVELTDFPLGSRQNPIDIELSALENGYKFDLTKERSIWYRVVAPETGVLRFSSEDIPWGFAIGFNGNTTYDECTVIQYYMKEATRPVTEGETFLLCVEYGAAEANSFTATIKYVPPFTIDEATQKQMFNGMYEFKSENNRLYGVEFNYERGTVAALDVKNDEFLGTYNFFYNLKNGALELTNTYGEKAPFALKVVEDADEPLGAHLELEYNGNRKITALTQDDIDQLKPSDAAIRTLNAKYEDIYMGEVWGTYQFFYTPDSPEEQYVLVGYDWETPGERYDIVSYSVFTGELVMVNAAGKEIVMNAIGGQVLYLGKPLVEVHVHSFRDTVTFPTCMQGGYTTYTCDCGESYVDDETAPLGHDLQSATCDQPTRCSRCDYTEGEALGHTWVDATCVAPKTCSVCGRTEGEALGHDVQSATCDQPASCSRCDYTEGEALGHIWQEATCVAPKTCATCGATEGAALGHQFNPATCTEAKTCKVCQATEGTALGHSWVNATCTTPKTCSVCDVTEGTALGHDMQPATCTKPSTCSRCDRTEGQVAPHSWDAGVVTKEPTEDVDGEKLLTCEVCGATQTQLIPAMGHEHKYTTTVVAPTCTEKGYTVHTCGCGDTFNDTYVNALGHNWNKADCTTPKTCKVCGETEGKAAGHDWKAATCVSPKTCKVCGKTEGGLVNHDWNAATCVTPKTCKDCGATEGGLADHKMNPATCVDPKTCSVCGHTEGAALGHDLLNATCSKPATCQRCGYTEGDTLPHTYNAVQGGGMITYTCTVCGHSYQESASTIAITVPGAMTGTFNGTQDYTWTADKAGYLSIDESAATRVRAQISAVLINGETAKKEVLGYPVSAGDVVVITVTTTYEVEINIPVVLKIYDGDAPMSFEAAFSGSKDFDDLWTAPSAGQFTFIISKIDLDNNGLLDNVTFRIIDNGGGQDGNMYNHYDEAFGIDADGNHYITLEVEEGEILRLLVMSDDYKTSGTLTITVKQGAPSVHEHTWEETERKEPTCTKNGYVRSKCTVCGEEDLKKLPYPGHTEEVIPGKAPTCTETGLSDGSKCSVCGETITEQTELPATGHTYGEWVTTKEPTATEDGIKTRTCTCGAEETEAIPALGEQPTDPQPTDPQPTEPKPTEPKPTDPKHTEPKPTEPKPTEGEATKPATKPATQPTTQPGDNTGNEGGNNTVLIIVIIAVVVIAGGAVVFVVMKKKK